MPACSSGTLTNVLPHRNAMPQTQDMTPHPVTVYRHRADLSLCYPLMWNVTLEYTASHFNVLGKTRPGYPSLTFHTHQQTLYDAVMVVVSGKLGRKYRTNRVLVRSHTGLLSHSNILQDEMMILLVNVYFGIHHLSENMNNHNR